MRVGVMTIGDEVLQGRILDKNKANLGQFFLHRGIEVALSINPPDEPQALQRALNYMMDEVDLLVITGGLGQTKDDMTYSVTKGQFPDFEEEIIPNHNGAAQGYLLKKNGKYLILVPGPPNENVPMFNVIDEILEKEQLYEGIFHLMGIGEYDLEQSFEENFGEEASNLLTYVSIGYVSLRVFSRDERQLEALIEKVENLYRDYIFYRGKMDLEESILTKLKDNRLTISCAESATSGGILKALTSVSGSSDVVFGGYVVYQEEAKIGLLGINRELLDTYSSVSQHTSRVLARSCRINTGTDLVVSLTGYAEHEDEALRGKCYVHIVSPWGEESFYRKVPSRNRNSARQAMIIFALASLWNVLAKMPVME